MNNRATRRELARHVGTAYFQEAFFNVLGVVAPGEGIDPERIKALSRGEPADIEEHHALANCFILLVRVVLDEGATK